VHTSFDDNRQTIDSDIDQPTPNDRQPGGGINPHDLISALPAAVYTTDAAGRITYYNAAAAQLWGCEPELGASMFCGSWRLYWPDGRPMRHDECPMAVTLKTGTPVRGAEAVAERPDGTRVPFMPYPMPLYNAAGQLVGAVNMLVDITERKAVEQTVRSRTRLFQTLNGVAKVIASDLNLDRIVETVTNIAVQISGARVGAFLIKTPEQRDETHLMCALPTREAFEELHLSKALLDATLGGAPAIRTDDMRADGRHAASGAASVACGGELRVASYLAVPVATPGRTHGALILVHPEPGVFTPETEDIVTGIAAHAAIAIDNAHLYESDRRLAAIVETSTDAIVGKNLNGIVTSWNQGAERLFGHTAEEMIGRPIMLIIPPDRRSEEDAILGRIRRGERVESYETVRVRKDGAPVDISLTVSPVRDAEGRIIGASKIAHDITERKQAQARQELLTREIHHRTKNLFAVVDAVVARSFAGKRTVEEAETAVRHRLYSLAQTHVMLLDKEWEGADLGEIVRTEMEPYAGRVLIEGPSIMLNTQATQDFAMALHELATNAAKYGALSNQAGQVLITWSLSQLNGHGPFRFRWEERGGPPVSKPERKGFGSSVLEQVMVEYFDKPPEIEFAPSGVKYEVSGSLEALAAKPRPDAAPDRPHAAPAA
jgi:PAS domain S-box-containing protein